MIEQALDYEGLKYYDGKSKNYIEEKVTDIQLQINDVKQSIIDMDAINATIGSPILLLDTADGALADLKVYGKSIQDGVPTPTTPIDIVSVGEGGTLEIKSTGENLIPYPYVETTKTTSSGVNFTINDDYSITVNGTNNSDEPVVFTVMDCSNLKENETYVLSGCPSGGSTEEYYLYMSWSNFYDFGEGCTTTFTRNKENGNYIRIQIGANVTVPNLTFKPMLCSSEITDKNYKPYKSSRISLSLNEPLRSVNDYKDMIACKDGVYGVIRRIGVKVIDGVNMKCTFIDATRYADKGLVQMNLGSTANWNDSAEINSTKLFLCDKFSYISNDIQAYTACKITDNSKVFAVFVPTELGITNDTQANEWLKSNNITVQYILAEEIFEPFIDQSIFDNIATYDNVTYITATDNADMWVEYYSNFSIGQRFANINKEIKDKHTYLQEQIELSRISLKKDINNKVDKTTTVNGKSLSSNITLSANDIGAASSQVVADTYAELNSNIKKVSSDVEQIVNNQIPYDYLKNAVDEYVDNNSGGFATQVDFNNLDDKISCGKNKFNKHDVTKGAQYNYTSGSYLVNDNYGYTKIKIAQNQNFVARYLCHICYYDALGNFIRGDVNSTSEPMCFTTPSNTDYMIVSILLAHLDAFQIELGDEFTYFKDFHYIFSENTAKSGEPNSINYFTIPINQIIPTSGNEHDQLLDGENFVNVPAFIQLPRNYDKYDKPVNLIMLFHGAGYRVTNNTFGIYPTEEENKNTSFRRLCNMFLESGYAICDINGYNDESQNYSFGCPRVIRAYRKLYEYIINHYNVSPYVNIFGFSMGGINALNFGFQNKDIVKCIALGAPITALYDQVYNSAHSTEANWREKLSNAYGFSEPKPMWTSTYGVNLSIEEKKYYENNKYLTYGYDPFKKIFTIGNKEIVIDSLPPIKIWHGEIDDAVGVEYSEKFVNALNNAGLDASLRKVAYYGHEICWGAKTNINYEYLYFIKRFNNFVN